MPVVPASDELPASTRLAAARVLYEPRTAGPSLAHCPLWLPLVLLAFSAALACYPLLFRLGTVSLADLKIHSTPEGLTHPAILFFLLLQFGAPLLAALGAWSAGIIMNAWLFFVLDAGAERRAVIRATAYGTLPLVVGNFLLAGVRAVAGPDSNPLNPLASNVAFFLDPTQTPVFSYEFAFGLDLFSAWAAATVALAVAGLVHRRVTAILPPVIVAWLALAAVRAWLLS